MTIQLHIEPKEADSGTMSYELDQSLITVGRSKSCHVELDHPEISRRHFIIKYIDDGYVLLDGNSRHGTIIDGVLTQPEITYPLGSEHCIEVPGFFIKLLCDGQQPHLERTTVVARQLLDDLLHEDVRPRENPSLIGVGRYHFRFVDEKTRFVLGRHEKADFMVTDQDIAEKHVSFARDIFGIRIIPLSHPVIVDGEIVQEPMLLNHGAQVSIGSLVFYFSETEQPLVEKIHQETIMVPPPAFEPTATSGDLSPPLRSFSIGALDVAFIAASIAILVGTIIIFVDVV